MSTSSPISELTELTEKPTNSVIQVQETSDGLTLTIPWRAGLSSVIRASVLISLWLGVLSWGISTSIQEGDVGPADWAIWSFFFLVGIGMLLGAASHFLQKTVFIVSQQTLSVRRLTWFGSGEQHWHSQELADVFVQHHPGDSESAEIWQLQIHPLLGKGKELGLVFSCRPDDMRWLATRLRHQLHCPGNAPCSPPPGYIVVSSETTGTDPETTTRNVAPFQERWEQPAESKVVLEELDEGIRLTIPPGTLWLGEIPTALAAIATVTALCALATVIVIWGGWNGMLTFAVVFTDCCLVLCYLSIVFANRRLGRQRAVIVVQGGQMDVLYTSPMFGREYHWSSQQQSPEVKLGHPWGFYNGLWELQIHSGQEKVGLLVGRDPVELQWLATLIRQALQQP